MTNREFYTVVINSELGSDVKEHAENLLTKLDATLEKRKSTQNSKKNDENAPIKAKILEVLGSEPWLASVIAEKVGVSTSKASALCRQLVEVGSLLESDVKVPKVGKRKAYAKA